MDDDQDKPDIEKPKGIKGWLHAEKTAIQAQTDLRAFQRLRMSNSAQKVINASASLLCKEAVADEQKKRKNDPSYENELSSMPKAMECAARKFQERKDQIDNKDDHYRKVEERLKDSDAATSSPSNSPADDDLVPE